MEVLAKLLEEIRDLLDHKENISIVLSSSKTSWNTMFSPPLFLNPKKKYEMALICLETYYSIPNINESNNTFVYNDGSSSKTITFPIGSYEITDINDELMRQLQQRGDEPYIKIGVNSATLKSTIQITNDRYSVNMGESTIRTLLGFNARILNGLSYQEGDNPVNILSINSILVTCNLIGGSYKDGISQPIIYSFFPDVSPGEKVIESPRNLVYLPITSTGSIGQIDIRLLDQNGNQIDLRGETVTVRLHIKSL
jgi:hypothetical protein